MHAGEYVSRRKRERKNKREQERIRKNRAKRENEKKYVEMADLVTVFLIEFQLEQFRHCYT